jgi:hypothetical protein
MGELTTPQPTYTVEQVHSLLERQPFADYYSGHFEDYITGGDGTKSLDEMKATSLAKLAELLKDFEPIVAIGLGGGTGPVCPIIYHPVLWSNRFLVL